MSASSSDDVRRSQAQRGLGFLAAMPAATGGAFFQVLLPSVCEALGADFAFVGELADDRSTLVTCAVAADGRRSDNFRCDLTGTPWFEVVRTRTGVRHSSNAGALFPDDGMLAAMGVESCFGEPLSDESGEVCGLLAAMSRRPTADDEVSRLLLRAFALRAAAELGHVRAIRQLEADEREFRATFEQAPVGLAHVRSDGRFLRVNERFCRIAGHPREDLLRHTFQVITHPDDLDADVELSHKLFDGEIERYSMEKRYVRKDGSTVWVNLSGSVVRDPSGKKLYAVAAIEDITQRKSDRDTLHRIQVQAARDGRPVTNAE